MTSPRRETRAAHRTERETRAAHRTRRETRAVHWTALLVCLLAAGCVTPEPILYPNETLVSAEPSQVDRDLEECSELAKKYKTKPVSRTGEVAQSTVEDAAIGGASGAVGGAVAGGSAGVGAAAGAAAGAVAGLLRGLFRASREPDSAYHLFVERCLSQRGYEVVGWE